jgi:thymidylate kinase
MKTIVIEGLSTSGKTTIANKVASLCEGKNLDCRIIDENTTLMPILQNRDPKVSSDHILSILKQAYSENHDLVIFDRLHLTSIAITDSSIDDFDEIEDILKKHETILVFLEIDEDKIESRIFDSLEYRGEWWREHLAKKGDRADVMKHYRDSQKKLFVQLKRTKLSKMIFNTTSEKYDDIAKEVYCSLNF